VVEIYRGSRNFEEERRERREGKWLKYIGVAEISRRRGEVRGEREVVEIYRGSRNFGHMRERRLERREERGKWSKYTGVAEISAT
jgi:hypothetical protein